MSALPTCPACGELRHPGLCMPALATMYADERAEHDEDRKRMAYLELQVADLKQQLYEERRWQN